MNPIRMFLCTLLLSACALSTLAMPHVIQYQGKLTDLSGVGYNGNFDMSFRIFNVPVGGVALWTEIHNGVDAVPVHKGLFDVALGSITPVNLPFDADYFLEITVDGNILLPRIPLTTSPYAFRAAIADSVAGGSGVGDTSRWEVHIAEPLIYAKNNPNVRVRNAGDNLLGDIQVIMEHDDMGSKGIFINRPDTYLGPDVSNLYAYRHGSSDLYGGSSWHHTQVDAGIKAYSYWGNRYSAAIAGYSYLDYDTSAAVIGAYQDGSVFGALGYNLGDFVYSGYFEGAPVHLTPQGVPTTAAHGDIYADNATNKLYFYNGASWIDLTAIPGAGSSLWTDHATDPYIFANNNTNVQVADATEDTFLTVINLDGTAIKAVGMEFPDPQYAYLGYGGECPAHPDGWRAAGVMAQTSYYVDAIYGYAADGGYGVFGVADGTDDYAGVRGYHANSMTNGRLATQAFGGEFDPGILLIPSSAPTAVQGAIYADDTDNKLYFYNGTEWKDLTAGGGGGVGGSGTANRIPLWTPDGTTLGNSKIRDEITYTLIHGVGMTPAKPGNFSVAADEATDYFGLWASNFNGRTTAGNSWTHAGIGGGGLYSDNNTDSKYYAGVFGFNWSDAETTAAIVGADYNSSHFGALAYRANSMTYAGYFSGDVHITGNLTVDGTSPGGGVGGSGEADKIAYWTGASDISYNTNLHWNNTSQYLGVGTNAPSKRLHIVDTSQPTQAIFGEISPITIIRWSPMIGFNTLWDHGIFSYAYYSSAPAGLINFDQELSGGFNILTAPNGTGGTAATMTSRLAITNDGNVGIGTTAPTTKLDVDGQIRIRGGVPGAGKVLTSDATGTATWETPTGGGGGCLAEPNPAGLLVSGDDMGIDVTLGFTFRTPVGNFTNAYVNTNGLLCFGFTDVSFTNSVTNLRNLTSPTTFAIAPYWEDLTGQVYGEYRTGPERYVFYWDAYDLGSSAWVTRFQCVIYPDGGIIVHYIEMNDIDNDGGGTIGWAHGGATGTYKAGNGMYSFVENCQSVPLWEFEVAASSGGGSGGAGFSAHANTSTSMSGEGYVIYDAVDYDDAGAYSTVNSAYTAPTAGLYHFDAAARLEGMTTGGQYIWIGFFVNGSIRKDVTSQTSTNTFGVNVSADLKLDAGDEVKVRIYCDQTWTTNSYFCNTYFNGHRVY